MSTVLVVAAALAFSFALGSLMRQVDGATLRRWRLSRRWDVSRLAREFIAAADEPLATVRGLMHMINAWERGVRKPSERYWLLYLRLFPECANGETASGGLEEIRTLSTTEITTMATALPAPAGPLDQGDIRALATTVRDLEQQVARLSKRLEELSPDEHGERKPLERRARRSGYVRGSWTPLWIALVPALAP